MQKQAPSIGRIMIAVGFALSCFGLLLFLWVAFGGPVPLKPQSYRFTADFAEAITLSREADVRISGVSVGKVKDIELPEDGNAARAVIEIDPEYAPISSDARAILRQKTLLGETYVEIAPGSQTDPEGTAEVAELEDLSGDDAVEPLPEGGHMDDAQVADQVQIDEIFNALDEETRNDFQIWMKNSGVAVDGRGLDLNSAFGNIGPFTEDASDVLATLRRQEQALRTIVASTGQVFAALTARDQELAGAIVGSNRTFRALASRDESLADTFQVLPTFEIESRLTLDRLEDFAHNAGPLFRDLRPVARDLSPTLRDLRRLAPNARRLFKNLDPLIDASIEGLPALRGTLDELRPVLDELDPFLANFNPVVRYLDYQSATLADFLTSPPAGLAGQLLPQPGQPSARHALRQASYISPETLSIYPTRSNTNRGNGYLQPFAIGNAFSASQGELSPSFDCANTGFPLGGSVTGGLGNGQVSSSPPSTPPPSEGGSFPASSLTPPLTPGMVGSPSAFAACTIAPNFPEEFGGGRAPQIRADP
jgi:phospholipid/cholesterol/gamma-HCH transport system substrate-binding protein